MTILYSLTFVTWKTVTYIYVFFLCGNKVTLIFHHTSLPRRTARLSRQNHQGNQESHHRDIFYQYNDAFYLHIEKIQSGIQPNLE